MGNYNGRHLYAEKLVKILHKMFLCVLIGLQVWARCGHRDIRQRPQFSMMMIYDVCVCDVQLKSTQSVEVHLGRSYTNQQWCSQVQNLEAKTKASTLL